jgi:hypothetical protein
MKQQLDGLDVVMPLEVTKRLLRNLLSFSSSGAGFVMYIKLQAVKKIKLFKRFNPMTNPDS